MKKGMMVAGLILMLLVGIIAISQTVTADKDKGSSGTDSNGNSGNAGSSGDSGGEKGNDKADTTTRGTKESENKGKTVSILAETQAEVAKKELEIAKESQNKGKENVEQEDKDELEVEIETELEIEEGEGKTKIKLKDGKEKEISIDQTTAKSIAFDSVMSDNFTITLNQSGEEVTYTAQAVKNGKFLWLFDSKIKIKATIDSQTGEVTVKKSWWAFLVAGEDRDESNSTKITICHKPGKSQETITIGRPALKAHIRHGDREGACESEPTNQTTSNETEGNTTIINETIGNTTIINQTESNLTIINETISNSTLVNSTEGNDTILNQTESNVTA
jgi:hypothetical protein